MNSNPVEHFVIYGEVGGIRNLDNRYEIHADGSVLTHTPMGGRSIPTRSSISEQELAQIILLFYANNFFSMQPSYEPPKLPSLIMTHEITYRYEGEEHTMRATNGGNPPQEFQNIVEGIEAIVR